MAAHVRVVSKRRATITALPLYYSGPLLKKSAGEKDFTEYHGELRGRTIFLYTDNMQETYTQRLDLETLKSPLLDSPNQGKMATVITLSLDKGDVQLKIDNADAREEWRGFILTVTNKEIPTHIKLMPGQMMQLQETLDQEKRRHAPQTRPPIPPRPPFLCSLSTSASPSSNNDACDHSVPKMPECFYDVTRQEAELMLERNPEYGSIILRPSTLANNYAVTLRQVKDSRPVRKNYRVSTKNSGFIIELDTPVMVASLNEVLKYFLEKTEYRLHPYVKSQAYDTHIDVPPVPEFVTISSRTPKMVPWAEVAPMAHSQETKMSSSPPRHSPPPTKASEGDYVVADDVKPSVSKFDVELREAVRTRKNIIVNKKRP